MRSGIVGLGFVGGNLLRYFKESEQDVIGYDIDPARTECDFVTLLERDIIFICVPTPYREGIKGYDLSIIEETLQKIADATTAKIVIIKSTVTPGTTKSLQIKHPNIKLGFVPEFLTERFAWEDTIHPDTSIFGYTEESHSIANDVLRILPEASFERIVPAAEAEMIKISRNNFFTLKNVFMNMLYDICQANDIDYEIVKDALASDRRIRRSHMEIEHNGGRGSGGTCMPKDTAAFMDYTDKTTGGDAAELIRTYVKINRALLDKSGKDIGRQYTK